MVKKMISGGQTGAEQAALDVAIELGIHHGGWVPKGRKTEDGRLPEKYCLREVPTISYSQRTEMNVLDSDGTLIISHGSLADDSEIAQELARKHRRPCLHIDLKETKNPKAVEIILLWIDIRKIEILNVTGPRGSKDPEIYSVTKKLLEEVLENDMPHSLEEAVQWLTSEMPLKSKNALVHMKKDELSLLHPSLGEYIKRRFGLWSVNKRLLSSCRFISGKRNLDSEDASKLIITTLWGALRDTHLLRIVKT